MLYKDSLIVFFACWLCHVTLVLSDIYIVPIYYVLNMYDFLGLPYPFCNLLHLMMVYGQMLLYPFCFILYLSAQCIDTSLGFDIL